MNALWIILNYFSRGFDRCEKRVVSSKLEGKTGKNCGKNDDSFGKKEKNWSLSFFQVEDYKFQRDCFRLNRSLVSFQDMDLIEVLWKQDVDLGFTLVEPTTATKKVSTVEKGTDDEIEKLKALEAINGSNEEVCKYL